FGMLFLKRCSDVFEAERERFIKDEIANNLRQGFSIAGCPRPGKDATPVLVSLSTAQVAPAARLIPANECCHPAGSGRSNTGHGRLATPPRADADRRSPAASAAMPTPVPARPPGAGTLESLLPG